MNIDIAKLNLVELQALGYRCIAQLEQAQRNLLMVNQEIERRGKEGASSSSSEFLVDVKEIVNSNAPESDKK